MKNIIKWLKNPASDFAIFVIVIVLANLVSNRAFFRIDLTEGKTYSLSKASVESVRTLEEPLSVKAFFTENLPAPYNNVAQYVRDLLVEYKGQSNGNFSYEFYDMDDGENQEMAQKYNLRQIQIQELKNNEVGFKQAWMGLVLLYADRIETIDQLSSTDGLEYKITTKIANMISTTASLSGLESKVKLTLYTSDNLSALGLDTAALEKIVRDSYSAVNARNMNKIDFDSKKPSAAEIDYLAETYGVQSLSWSNRAGEKYRGVLGLVLESADGSRSVPLSLERSFFGYSLAGLDNLEDTIQDTLKSLVSKAQEIGYITGHGESSLNDSQTGAALFSNLLSDMYTLKEIDLTKDSISTGISVIVINGAKTEFSDVELYKIDQFLLRGGSVALFADPFLEVQNNQQNYFGANFPSYEPIETGLSRLLEKYGAKIETGYVFDKQCYSAQTQDRGIVKLNWVPLLHRSGLSQKNPVSANLGYVLFLKSGAIDVSAAEAMKSVKTTVLAKSSAESWLKSEGIFLNPDMISEPKSEEMKSHKIAVLLEGNFESAFETAVTSSEKSAENAENAGENEIDLTAESHLKKSVQPGKIFIAATSSITSPELIDDEGSQPIAIFVRNAIDYLSGKSDFCQMRTKALSSLNALSLRNGAAVALAKIFNQYILVILVAVAGLFAWSRRAAHRKAVRMQFDPNDAREGDSIKKEE